MARKDDTLSEVLQRGIISEETAEERTEHYRKMLVRNGKGPEFYVRNSKRPGRYGEPEWDIQLWRRG